MDIVSTQVFDTQGDLEKNVQAFLNAHGTDVAHQKRFPIFQRGIRRNRLEGIQVGAVANDEDVLGSQSAAVHSQLFVTFICSHHDVTEPIGGVLEPNLYFVKRAFFLVLRKVKLGAGVVVIENIFDPEKFKRQRDQENVIRRVAALNYPEPAAHENPPGIQELPSQGIAVFEEITEGTISFFSCGVAVNMNAFQ